MGGRRDLLQHNPFGHRTVGDGPDRERGIRAHLRRDERIAFEHDLEDRVRVPLRADFEVNVRRDLAAGIRTRPTVSKDHAPFASERKNTFSRGLALSLAGFTP